MNQKIIKEDELPEIAQALLNLLKPPNHQGNGRFGLGRSAIVLLAPYIIYLIGFYKHEYIPWVLHVYSVAYSLFGMVLISRFKEEMAHLLNPFDFVKVQLLNFINIVVLFGLSYFFISKALTDQFNNQNSGFFDYIYFSFVTITTLGYGDIHPIGWYSRLLVILELCFGLWFVITVIPVAVADQAEKMRDYRMKKQVFDAELKKAIENGDVIHQNPKKK